MGFAKRQMELRDEQQQIVSEILVDQGSMEHCGSCNEFTDNGGFDEELVRGYVQDLVAQQDQRLASFHGDVNEVIEAMRNVVREASSRCRCERVIASSRT